MDCYWIDPIATVLAHIGRAMLSCAVPCRHRRGAWGRPPRGLGRPHREGHRRRRGAWGRPPRGLGGHGLGEGGGVLNVIEDKLLKYKEKTGMKEIPKNPSLTWIFNVFSLFYPKPKMIPGSIRTFW